MAGAITVCHTLCGLGVQGIAPPTHLNCIPVKWIAWGCVGCVVVFCLFICFSVCAHSWSKYEDLLDLPTRTGKLPTPPVTQVGETGMGGE